MACPICGFTQKEFEDAGCDNPRKGQNGCYAFDANAEQKRQEEDEAAARQRFYEAHGPPLGRMGG